MSQHKYKIGDKVRIKKREGDLRDYPLEFIDSMAIEGKILIIDEIEIDTSLNKNAKYYDGDNTIYRLSNGYYYHSSMFEPVSSSSMTEITDLKENKNVTLFGFKGCVNTCGPKEVFIYFTSGHYTTCKKIKQKVPNFDSLAESYKGNAIGKCFPTFPSLYQLTLFINALKQIEQSNFTPQNKNQNENNEIRFQKPKTSIERGTVPEGHQICGKRSRTSIIVGHLSNRAWNL